MFDALPAQKICARAVVVGAGIGGMSSALRLLAAGYRVTVVERHGWVGGKMRTVPSEAGPVDAGPTVMTMRHVFDDLFAATGTVLDDYVTLVKEPVLARHFWPDGSVLDLFDEQERSADAVQAFSGTKSRDEFLRFSQDCAELFDLFDAPMMQAAEPKLVELGKAAFSEPRFLPALLPTATLAKLLRSRFSDPRLAQLFGRYATYVGGAPDRSPALLSLIWQAEAAGVWRVQGGMHKLAEAMAKRVLELGGTLLLQTGVKRLAISDNRCRGVVLEDGRVLDAEVVVFNGDPRAMALGLMGEESVRVAAVTRRTPRSLSARVWSFAAEVVDGPELIHHNVFFGTNPLAEFDDIRQGKLPSDPTIYVCAEDRGVGTVSREGAERFEMILNAAPLTKAAATTEEVEICRQVTFQTLGRFGLRFDREPPGGCLTTPEGFEAMFPGSAGSIYGQSPHGMTASLRRPRARTKVQGLYLAGGGTHPGAGVPMAALSGRHAAEAILADRVLT